MCTSDPSTIPWTDNRCTWSLGDQDADVDDPAARRTSGPECGRRRQLPSGHCATQGLEIPDFGIQKGFAEVNWPARFQVVRREPPVILDSAHNQDSFARLRQALDDYFPGRPVYLVFGASEDKNIPGMFAEIKSKVRQLIITRADHPRALEPEQDRGVGQQAQIPYEVLAPVRGRFRAALELSEKDGSIVLSAGSMFVTAEALAVWQSGGSEDRDMRNILTAADLPNLASGES